MNQIPTAEEFLKEEAGRWPRTQEAISSIMIEFAQLHVEAALKAAAEKALVNQRCTNYNSGQTVWDDQSNEVYVTVRNENSYDEYHVINVDEESILNAYPKELIQ